jgi:hypothetical protein
VESQRRTFLSNDESLENKPQAGERERKEKEGKLRHKLRLVFLGCKRKTYQKSKIGASRDTWHHRETILTMDPSLEGFKRKMDSHGCWMVCGGPAKRKRWIKWTLRSHPQILCFSKLNPFGRSFMVRVLL